MQCRAVYHLVVTKCENQSVLEDEEDKYEELPLVVKMKNVGKHSCLVSPKMAAVLSLPKQPTCELQVVNLQSSYR